MSRSRYPSSVSSWYNCPRCLNTVEKWLLRYRTASSMSVMRARICARPAKVSCVALQSSQDRNIVALLMSVAASISAAACAAAACDAPEEESRAEVPRPAEPDDAKAVLCGLAAGRSREAGPVDVAFSTAESVRTCGAAASLASAAAAVLVATAGPDEAEAGVSASVTAPPAAAGTDVEARASSGPATG
jgi:hypothetical protein